MIPLLASLASKAGGSGMVIRMDTFPLHVNTIIFFKNIEASSIIISSLSLGTYFTEICVFVLRLFM